MNEKEIPKIIILAIMPFCLLIDCFFLLKSKENRDEFRLIIRSKRFLIDSRYL